MSRLVAFLVLTATLVLACSASAALRIVATTPALAAVAKEVGGSNVRVTALSLASQDPHFVDAKPSLALEVAKADLLIANGLDLEIGWLRTLQVGSKNGKIQVGADGYLDCSALVRVLDVPATVDRSQGDVHPLGNPHYMFDPRQAARAAKGIADRLVDLDPEHGEEYRKGALKFIRKLGKATRGWEEALANARGAKVVGYHKSFVYLADWLGLVVVEDVEPRPGIPPNPHHVTHVIETMNAESVRALLQESFYPRKTSDLIAKQTSATVVRIPGGPAFKKGESYVAHMDSIVKNLGKVYGK